MNINFSVEIDAAAVTRALAEMQNQIPFATSLAINKTAQLVRRAIVTEMKRVFDRPTPFALNSLFIEVSTKTKLNAKVWLKDGYNEGFDGTPAVKYLTPEIYGGPRRAKSHERRLRDSGILGSSMFAAPARGAQGLLNRYGNLSGGIIRQMTSGLGIDEERAGYQSNITDRSRRRNKRRGKYFVMGGERPVGISRRVSGGGLQPFLWFVRAPNYRPRLDFFGVAQKVIDENLEKELEKAINNAIRTARIAH